MQQKILVLGATGRTARHAIPYALEKGYQVVALVRNQDKINILADEIEIITGLSTNIDDVRKAMQGCEAVISFLSPLSRGTAISLKKIDPPHVLENSLRIVLQVMEEQQVKRLMILSTVGTGDTWYYLPWYVKLLGKYTNFKHIFADHNAQEQLVMASATDWTIVRAAGLNEKPVTGKLKITYDQKLQPFQLSRRLLAKFFIDNLNNAAYFQKAPMLGESSYKGG